MDLVYTTLKHPQKSSPKMDSAEHYSACKMIINGSKISRIFM
jgi:hypothetical protein